MNKYLRKDLIDNWNKVNGDWLNQIDEEERENKHKELTQKFYRALAAQEYQAAAKIADELFHRIGYTKKYRGEEG